MKTARAAEAAALDIREVTRRLQPLRRDLVSDGIDEAFAILQDYAPFRLHEFESGSSVWTWRVPEKWQCEEAYVETLDGRRVIDAAVNPLHVASYSEPVDRVVSRAELEEHLADDALHLRRGLRPARDGEGERREAQHRGRVPMGLARGRRASLPAERRRPGAHPLELD